MAKRRKEQDVPEGTASAGQQADLKVFIAHQESTCDDCRQNLGRGAWILLAGERGALCLTCADLDHLAFLPPGNAALTRRAKKHSRLSAVVLEYHRGRGHYERQGLLVEEAALAKAEDECLADSELRHRRQLRAEKRREEIDQLYVSQFAERIRALFPGCPVGREQVIAEHACQKYSGRVGRSAAAKEFDEGAVRMAVVAHIRHVETNYDTFLGAGYDRSDARYRVASQVDRVLDLWMRPTSQRSPGKISDE